MRKDTGLNMSKKANISINVHDNVERALKQLKEKN